MFFITAGYHRYFAHRSFKTSRFFQFILAFGGATAAQKGPLWWAGHHRNHHKYSDTEMDLHSPRQRGFWWSHMGWILSYRYNDAPRDRIRDMERFPELRLIDRLNLVPPLILAAVCYFAFDLHTLVWAFYVPTVLLWHGTFTINSLSHRWGKQPYQTTDDSRNHWLLALITMGEGWHNNHHHYMNATRQGYKWYEIDLSFYILWVLERLRIVRSMHRAPAHIMARKTPPAADESRSETAEATSVAQSAA